MRYANLAIVGGISFAAGLLAGLSIAVLSQADRPAEVAAQLPDKVTEGIAAERARKLLDGKSAAEAGYAVEPFVPLSAGEELTMILLVRDHLNRAGERVRVAEAETAALGIGWMKAMALIQMCIVDQRVLDLLRCPELQHGDFRGIKQWYEPRRCFSDLGHEWFLEEIKASGLLDSAVKNSQLPEKLDPYFGEKLERKHKPIRTAPDWRPYDGSNVEGDVGDGAEFGENKGEIGSGIGLGPKVGFGPARQSNPPKAFRPGMRQSPHGQAK